MSTTYNDEASERYKTHYDAQAPNYDAVHSFTKDIAAQIVRTVFPHRPSTSSESWVIHDNACGPGIVTEQLIEHFSSRESLETGASSIKIAATDFSPGMISVLSSKLKTLESSGCLKVTAEVMDSQSLSFPDSMFTHSITDFAIFLFPDPPAAAQEIHRTLASGGVAVVTSWSKLDWLTTLQKVQLSMHPNEEPWQGPFAEGWVGEKGEQKLINTMVDGGFERRRIEIDKVSVNLTGNVRDGYLESMKGTWVREVTKDWKVEDREEFRRRLKTGYERLTEVDEPVCVEAVVAVCRK